MKHVYQFTNPPRGFINPRGADPGDRKMHSTVIRRRLRLPTSMPPVLVTEVSP